MRHDVSISSDASPPTLYNQSLDATNTSQEVRSFLRNVLGPIILIDPTYRPSTPR